MRKVLDVAISSVARSTPVLAHGVILLGACVAFASVVVEIVDGAPAAHTNAAIGVWIFIAACLASIGGFAFAPLASVGLIAVGLSPISLVGLIVVCSIAIQVYGLVALRSAVDWRRAWPLIASGLLTVPIGVACLSVVPMSTFQIALGSTLVAYASLALMPVELRILRASRSGEFIAGALGGLVGGLSGFPSGPIVVWCKLRGLDKSAQRGVCQPYILTMQIATLAWMQRSIDFSVREHQLLLVVPVALLAAALGVGVFRKLSSVGFGLVVNCLLLLTGIALIMRPLLGSE